MREITKRTTKGALTVIVILRARETMLRKIKKSKKRNKKRNKKKRESKRKRSQKKRSKPTWTSKARVWLESTATSSSSRASITTL